MASSKDRSKDDEIYIPHDFVRSVQGWDDIFKQLQDNNEWLAQVDKRLSDSELSILRHAFLTDGHNFISFLTEYLNAVKWQEFIVYICTQRISYVPVLMHLIYEASLQSRGADVQDSVGTEPTNLVFNHKIRNLKDSKLLHQGCIEAIRSRYCESSLPVDGRRDHFAGLTIETSTEADALITEVEADMKQLDRTHIDDMTFGYGDNLTTYEPTCLSCSRRWTTIGKNLCDLGLRVGADVPRWPTEPKRWTIITALRAVINNEGPGVNVMLARLEKHQVHLQKQQQVITALQFRHLLEHLPVGVRDRWLAGASSKSDKVSQASRWERMKEVEKWREFWSESVRQIFRVYKEKGQEAWEGIEGHEPSPFANLLKYYLGQAYKKKTEQEALTFLADETDVGERANKLYNTLSQIIHQYSDSSFEVNRFNFSPLDAHILTALVPKNARHDGRNHNAAKDESWVPLDEKAEIVAWKKEFRRYVWEKPAVTTQTTSNTNKKLLDRVKEMWKYLRSRSPFSELFPKDLIISSAISDVDACTATINATVLLDKKQINSCNMIHNAVLSAFFDAIGRMSLMAAGRRVTSDRVGLSVESSFLAHPGDEVQVIGTLMRDEQDPSFSTTIHMKTANDTMVASGYFKAWGVRETNGSEAYDSMN
ncbi:hypothetical protein ACHAPO_005995 [Fusarium lateritium]